MTCTGKTSEIFYYGGYVITSKQISIYTVNTSAVVKFDYANFMENACPFGFCHVNANVGCARPCGQK